jgi:hypothetical protein
MGSTRMCDVRLARIVPCLRHEQCVASDLCCVYKLPVWGTTETLSTFQEQFDCCLCVDGWAGTSVRSTSS